jgi:hypothetical protein
VSPENTLCCSIYSTFRFSLYTVLSSFDTNFLLLLYIPTHGPKPGLVTVTVTNPEPGDAVAPPRNPVGNVEYTLGEAGTAHGGVIAD